MVPSGRDALPVTNDVDGHSQDDGMMQAGLRDGDDGSAKADRSELGEVRPLRASEAEALHDAGIGRAGPTRTAGCRNGGRKLLREHRLERWRRYLGGQM